MLRRISGIFVFAIGLALAAWIAYNLLIHMDPAARGDNPLPGVAMSALFMWVGVRWIRGREAG